VETRSWSTGGTGAATTSSSTVYGLFGEGVNQTPGVRTSRKEDQAMKERFTGAQTAFALPPVDSGSPTGFEPALRTCY